jgi:hypothetical protein
MFLLQSALAGQSAAGTVAKRLVILQVDGLNADLLAADKLQDLLKVFELTLDRLFATHSSNGKQVQRMQSGYLLPACPK